MVTNLHAAVVLIVFAGGPHTEPRTAMAERLLDSIQPHVIYLSGAEYATEDQHLVRRLNEAAARLASHPQVIVETNRSTLRSCGALRREIEQANPEGASVVAITSNYHAPRLRWLLGAMLPRRYSLSVLTSPDIPWRLSLSSPTNRQLVRGEILSWLYAFPLGLCLRPWYVVALALAAIASFLARRRRAS